ncbi:MAG: transglycosylase SLT domain-containing protein [Thermodesulfobacteriota bacterium]
MRRYLIVLFLILILLPSCAARRNVEHGGTTREILRPEAALASALEAIRLGREDAGVAALLRIREDYQGTTWAARASFVLGMEALRGNGPGAAEFLREALTLEVIRPYVLLNLARAYNKDSDLDLAESIYESAARDYPEFAYRGEALYERALVLEEMGRTGHAVDLFKDFLREYPGHARADEALLRSVRLEVARKDYDSALPGIKTLLVSHPGKKPALEAANILSKNKILLPLTLSAVERCERSEALFASGLYKNAAEELQGLINEDIFCRNKAETLLVETLFRLKRYDEAESILERRVRRGHRDHEQGYAYRKALSLLATVYLRENKTERLLETIETLARNFPHSYETRRGLLIKASYYEDTGRWEEALGTYNLLMKANTGIKERGDKEKEVSRESLIAAWKRGWLLYRRGRYIEAYNGLNLYRDSLGWDFRRKFAYWRGRALDKAGMKEEALKEYRLACKSATPGYYCYMAKKRLGDNGAVVLPWDEGPGQLVRDLRTLEDEKAFKAVFALISTGLTSEAAVEAKRALKKTTPNREVISGLMSAFYRAGDYYHAIWMYDSYFYLLQVGGKTISPGLLRVAFPIKMVDYMSTKGLSGEADPLLVAAVMREESSFNPGTISKAGALGLMQVMPSTARFIAEASKMGPLSRGEILDPDTNIRLGAWYLAYLWHRTDGDPVETIAGYNAGLNVVKRWRERYPLPDDEFIESIPYTETRRYTKKVLKSYEAFRELKAGRGPVLAYSPKAQNP